MTSDRRKEWPSILTGVDDVEVKGVDDRQRPESDSTGGAIDDCRQLRLARFDRSVELVSSGQSHDRFETLDPGVDLGVVDRDVAENLVVVVAAVEAAPDFPQEIQLPPVGHRPVGVSPEASRLNAMSCAISRFMKSSKTGWTDGSPPLGPAGRASAFARMITAI